VGSGHQQAVPLLGQVTVAVPFGVPKGRNVILLKVGIILLCMIRLVEWPTFEFGPNAQTCTTHRARATSNCWAGTIKHAGKHVAPLGLQLCTFVRAGGLTVRPLTPHSAGLCQPGLFVVLPTPGYAHHVCLLGPHCPSFRLADPQHRPPPPGSATATALASSASPRLVHSREAVFRRQGGTRAA